MKTFSHLLIFFLIATILYSQPGHLKSAIVDSAPRLLEMPKPIYPEIAKTNKIEGKVYLKFDVAKDGTVTSVTIIKSDNPIFDSSAVSAAKRAMFIPAKSKGNSISESIILPVAFELISESEKLLNAAQIALNNGNYNEAIDILNKAIAQNPSISLGYKLRGDCFAKIKQYPNSRLDYRRAVSLENKNSSKRSEYEEALHELLKGWYKKLDQKIENYKKEIAVDKEKSSNYLEVAKCYREMEEWKRAEKWYDEFLSKEENIIADEILRYSSVIAKNGSIIKGEKILKRFAEQFPLDWRLWSRYGYFAMWLGKNDSAKTAFEAALKYKPNFKEAQDGLYMVNKLLSKQ